MTTKLKTITVFTLVVLAFLLGFVPQYLAKRQIQLELATSLEKVRLSELRDISGLMLLEGLRQNYGVAQNYSSQYFDKLREASEGASNAALRKSLQDLLQNRDTVTAALSKADPASASQLQAISPRPRPQRKRSPDLIPQARRLARCCDRQRADACRK